MKGVFWNIRGLNQPGIKLSLEYIIKTNHVDFVGIQETKK
jgi:exonuclease III